MGEKEMFVYEEKVYLIIDRSNRPEVEDRIENLIREIQKIVKEYGFEMTHQEVEKDDKTYIVVDIPFLG